jgi:hypothetical protein
MVAGTEGAANNVLVNLLAFLALLPQSDVYINLMLSPVKAAALLVNVTVIFCEFTLPESIVAVPNKDPTNDHT